MKVNLKYEETHPPYYLRKEREVELIRLVLKRITKSSPIKEVDFFASSSNGENLLQLLSILKLELLLVETNKLYDY